jgi:hypothetical protein
MHKSATKCNETIGKWCKNKHGASKIIDTFETYHAAIPWKLFTCASMMAQRVNIAFWLHFIFMVVLLDTVLRPRILKKDTTFINDTYAIDGGIGAERSKAAPLKAAQS